MSIKKLLFSLLSIGALQQTSYAAELTILGSGSCMPVAHRKAPGNLVSAGDTHILVDSGPGILQAATKHIDVSKLHGAFYTHFHFDHIGDLPDILTWLHVNQWSHDLGEDVVPPAPFTIYGPIGIEEHVTTFLNLAFAGAKPTKCVKFVELSPGQTVDLGDFKVTAHKVPHTKESMGYRFAFNNGKSLAISGDTAPGNTVVKLIENADVAVLECSYSDEFNEKALKVGVNHLSPTSAGQQAQMGNVKTLVLTHIYPSAEQTDIYGLAKKAFSGTVIVGSDDLKIALK